MAACVVSLWLLVSCSHEGSSAITPASPGRPPSWPLGGPCVWVSLPSRQRSLSQLLQVFPSLLRNIIENLSFSWAFFGASPGAGVCPHCLPGCLTLGNCVPEEERQVHQPGPEAHRHLGSHGLAASPGQLRGASRAPAGSATGECVGSAHGASPLSGVSADSEWAVSPPGAPSSPPHSVLSLGSSEHLARLILRTGLHSAPVLSSSLVC